jgi:hypothetical protein
VALFADPRTVAACKNDCFHLGGISICIDV